MILKNSKNVFVKVQTVYPGKYAEIVSGIVSILGNNCTCLNRIEQWLQNKRPFLKCKLFYNEMNFLKKNLSKVTLHIK